MRNIFMLAAANIRKSKSQAVSLLVFVLIAAMFLNIGLVMFFEYGKAFDNRAEELNAPHLVIFQEERITTDEQFTWLNQRSVETERYSVISGWGEYYPNDLKSPCVVVFSNADGVQSMNPPSLIGDSLPLIDGSLYVPYMMKSTAGYKVGDDFKITLTSKEITYKIAGFTEDITFSAPMNQLYRFYLNNAEYLKLENEFPELKCIFMAGRFDNPEHSIFVSDDYKKEFFFTRDISDLGAAFIWIWTLSYSTVKENKIMIPLVISMIVTVFAFILLAVSLIVMRFGIVNNIDESMVNIGALKAVGYRNRQIVCSILLQFGGISVIGSILGLCLSSLLMPAISAMFEVQSAMIWNPGFNPAFAAVTLLLVVSAVLLVSFMAARRIFGLHPLVALRGGILTHNFKKNRVPLDKWRGGLSFLLALKQLVKAKRQSVMIVLIISAVSFASVAGIALYYTIGIQTNKFVLAMMGEMPDAGFIMNDRNDTDDLIVRLREREDVRKVFGFQYITLMAGETGTAAIIAEDCALLEGAMLIGGWYPKHDNEIAASGVFMRLHDKKTGDTVTIRHGSREAEYIITGEIQTVMNNVDGSVILMNYSGLMNVQPDYIFDQIYVYLNRGTAESSEFIKSVEASEGDIFASAVDITEIIEVQFGSFGDIFAAVAAIILAITVIIVILVLYLVIKTAILRRKREFGIQKAIGFTTLQIMNQLAFNFMPIISIGVVLGGIGGFFGLNPVFVAMVSGMGMAKTDFSAPIAWSVMVCAALIILAYGVSMLIAWRIRKISAYSLISE